ncbi:MAG: WYL domain-containing protein [Actinomycetia bacterium]|nr:WYL domain-containing protein [Actinomycetes bacterium]
MPDLFMRHLETLFALLSSLKRHDVIAIDKLAERLGVDAEALRRDLELLQYSGVPPYGGGDLLPLELDEDGYLEVTGVMPALNRPLRLSFEQALALVLALEIAGYGTGDTLVEKISRIAHDDAHQLDVAQLARQLRAGLPGHATATFEAVTQALTEGRALAITYRRSDGATTKRTIEPWLLFTEGDQWYLTAFCRLRERVQNFRLNRIETALLAEPLPECNRGSGALPHPGGIAGPEETVPIPSALDAAKLPLARLRFADAAAFDARNWPGARVTGRARGSLEVDVPYAAESGDWFARHVCAGAGQITVLFPEEARALVRAYAQTQLM